MSFWRAGAFGSTAFCSAMVSSCWSGRLRFTDQQPAVGEERVGRHFEVVGRGLVLEHAAGQVEGGAMAGAQEAAHPVLGQRGLRARLEAIGRRAAEVRADADDDEVFGL